ncbi:MAG: hypothetical protein AAGJ38_05050 [Planctomycetota bacterium]
MSTIYTKDGSILAKDGAIATHDNCCCRKFYPVTYCVTGQETGEQIELSSTVNRAFKILGDDDCRGYMLGGGSRNPYPNLTLVSASETFINCSECYGLPYDSLTLNYGFIHPDCELNNTTVQLVHDGFWTPTTIDYRPAESGRFGLPSVRIWTQRPGFGFDHWGFLVGGAWDGVGACNFPVGSNDALLPYTDPYVSIVGNGYNPPPNTMP